VARKYQHPYKHYAELYGVSEVTIKRHAGRGRPLDDPDAMGEFLSPRGRKPDEAVRKTEGGDDFRTPHRGIPRSQRWHPDTDGPRARTDRAEADDLEAEARLFRPPPEFFEGEGLAAEIRRLTVLAKEAAKRLGDAMAEHDARARQNRIAEYLQLTEALRKVEKEHPGILLQNEKAILITDVEEGLTRLLLAIVERLRTIPVRAMQTVPGLEPVDVREELEREIEQALEPIRKCEWLPEEHRPADLTPQEPAPTEVAESEPVPKLGTKKKKPAAKKNRAAARK